MSVPRRALPRQTLGLARGFGGPRIDRGNFLGGIIRAASEELSAAWAKDRRGRRVYAGMMRAAAAALISLALAAAPRTAAAFCGFYVAGGDQKMFNDATQVVLMRDGTRTVLSMQNNYKGPPEAFAMVVPVPVVLHEGDVKTLPRDVFERVEHMGAPRLVEYWEQDPCMPEVRVASGVRFRDAMPAPPMATREASLGVTIEAQFTVGEYQVVILSARDSTGLETWLTREKYRIPEGAEPLLRPYVEGGSKFFVARVDLAKVTFDGDGRAALSPLRFHYDSDEFTLPIRLGLANSSGTQDLIVNILAPHQRYEVANAPNVTIPTNIDVGEVVKDKFPAFYTALFDRTIEKNPGAVVTEYAWQASTCDPCPGPTLDAGDFATLGADVLGDAKDRRPDRGARGYDLVLTRLHARYGKAISDDLRFRAAAPIAGGREHVQNGQGGLEEGAQPAAQNNFQGRYAIRHVWTGPIRCEHPRRKLWGGPPVEIARQPGFIATGVKPAVGLAFAPRGQIDLTQVVRRDVPELGITAGKPLAPPDSATRPGSAGPAQAAPRSDRADTRADTRTRSGCGCRASDPRGGLAGALVIAAGLWIGRRRRPS
jgi:MYXO-CTERM domain-containing protein